MHKRKLTKRVLKLYGRCQCIKCGKTIKLDEIYYIGHHYKSYYRSSRIQVRKIYCSECHNQLYFNSDVSDEEIDKELAELE